MAPFLAFIRLKPAFLSGTDGCAGWVQMGMEGADAILTSFCKVQGDADYSKESIKMVPLGLVGVPGHSHSTGIGKDDFTSIY